VGGSDRVTLIWPDGAIQKQWLQVTVLGGGSIGLAAPDVFYFGNAIGETGINNAPGYANVGATDEIGARNNPKTLFPASNQASIGFIYDFNRDKQVNPADQLIARSSATVAGAGALQLISVPGVAFAAAAPVSALMVAADQSSAPADSAAIAEALATPSSSPFRLFAEQNLSSSQSVSAKPLPVRNAADVVAAAFASSGFARRQASQIALLEVALEDSWLDLLAHQRIKAAKV
jgi:hypothetical protein